METCVVAPAVLIGIDAIVLDQLLEVSAEQLSACGVREDSVAPMLDPPPSFCLSQEVPVVPGGLVVNALRVAAWMSDAVTRPVFYGCGGTDAPKDHTALSAVDVRLWQESLLSVSTVVLVPPSRRRAILYMAEGRAPSKGFIAQNAHQIQAAVFSHASALLYSSAFFLDVGMDDLIQPTMARAAALGWHFALNLGSTAITERVDRAVRDASVVFGNEAEWRAYAGYLGWSSNLSLAKMASGIASLDGGCTTNRIIVITQGASPTLVHSDGAVFSFAVPQRQVVDDTGAGDAFAGGFLHALCRWKPIVECVRAGHFAAAHVVQCHHLGDLKTPTDGFAWANDVISRPLRELPMLPTFSDLTSRAFCLYRHGARDEYEAVDSTLHAVVARYPLDQVSMLDIGAADGAVMHKLALNLPLGKSIAHVTAFEPSTSYKCVELACDCDWRTEA